LIAGTLAGVRVGRPGCAARSQGWPLLGGWIRQQELSRWTACWRDCCRAGCRFLTAIELTAKAVTLADVGHRLRLTMGDIGRGESLSRALASYALLPATALSMSARRRGAPASSAR